MTLLVLSITSLLVGLSWGGVQYAWASVQVVGLLVVAVVSTVAFVAVELRSPNPIMPMRIYRNRVVGLSMIAVFCTGFGMFGGIVFIPLFRGCSARPPQALAAS